MAMNASTKRKMGKAAYYVCLVIFSVIFLFPIYCMILQSVVPNSYYSGLPKLFPKISELQLKTYTTVFKDIRYLYYLKNTLIVCVSNILGVCIGSSFCAYGLAKVPFKGKGIVFGVILATVLLPGVVTSIPLYIVYSKIGWNSSLLPLSVPIWFGGGAMNIFLCRQFVKGIPDSLSEAAILDGANSFKIYYSIVLPLIRPILVYLAITTFLGQWNDFQGPMMYVKDTQSKWTLSLALYKNFSNTTSSAVLPNVNMAIGVLMMIPGTVLFAFFQQELMEGVTMTGLKG